MIRRTRVFLGATLAATIVLGTGCSASNPTASRTALAQGASSAELRFAIRQVAEQVRPAIVQITNLQQQPDQVVGAAVPSGVGSGVIGGVVPGSPAAAAGLRARDVITAVDGQPLTDESALAELLSQKKPGDSVTLTIVRGDQQQDLTATLGDAPQQSP